MGFWAGIASESVRFCFPLVDHPRDQSGQCMQAVIMAVWECKVPIRSYKQHAHGAYIAHPKKQQTVRTKIQTDFPHFRAMGQIMAMRMRRFKRGLGTFVLKIKCAIHCPD